MVVLSCLTLTAIRLDLSFTKYSFLEPVLMGRTLHPLKATLWGMRNGAIASLLIVAIVVGAGAGYFIGYSNERTSTTNVSELVLNSYITANAVCASTLAMAPASEVPLTYSTHVRTFNSCPTACCWGQRLPTPAPIS